jgi:hypothetical protein
MPIRQVSVAVKNQPGAIHEVCGVLEKEQINIKAIMGTAKEGPSQLHMVTDNPDKAISVLESKGFVTSSREVLAVITPDHPGGLNAILRTLLEREVNVELIYPFIYRNNNEAILILEVDKVLEAKEILGKQWIKTVGEEIYKT